MFTDLSASFKRLYHEVFENPQGKLELSSLTVKVFHALSTLKLRIKPCCHVSLVLLILISE